MFFFCARNDTHSPAFVKVGSVTVVVPLKPISLSGLVPVLPPTLIGVAVTVMVLFAFAAAYAPPAPNVSAPAARPAAIFTFDVIRNMFIQFLLELNRFPSFSQRPHYRRPSCAP